MDLLDWKTLNPITEIKDTKKKFFNRYYYNIKYWCPGGRLILSNLNISIEEAIQWRRYEDRSYNYGGSWRSKGQSHLMDKDYLSDMRDLKQKFPNIKFRIEEPHITIYSDNEQTLYDLAERNLSQWNKYLVSVHRPIDDNVKTLLDNNAIIFKTNINYKYKFICRDGHCENKEHIYNYLDELGDQVRVSDTVWMMLEKPSKYIWGVWFYGNEKELSYLLNIIEPNFVSNIHEVVVL